jgi:hypothetical protein
MDLGVYEGQLVPSEAVYGDFFGFDVDLAGDTAIVGAYGGDPDAVNAGEAYVYRRVRGEQGPSWVQRATLVAPGGAAHDNFGQQVALDGGIAAVGACMRDLGDAQDVGAVYLYQADADGGWRHQATLQAPTPRAGARFGWGLDVWGDRLVVGAYQETTEAGPGSGAVYVYRRQADTGGWRLEARLEHPRAVPGAEFGVSVAGDGERLVVGAMADDVGGHEQTGSAHVFEYLDGQWRHRAELGHPEPGYWDDFGMSVAIERDVVVVGAYFDSTPAGAHAGTVHVFRLDEAARWGLEASLVEPAPGHEHYFGIDVQISDGRVLAGAYGGPGGGRAHLFERRGGAWAHAGALVHPAGRSGDMFGFAVALSGDRALVGAQHDYTGADEVWTGSAQAWRLPLPR